LREAGSSLLGEPAQGTLVPDGEARADVPAAGETSLPPLPLLPPRFSLFFFSLSLPLSLHTISPLSSSLSPTPPGPQWAGGVGEREERALCALSRTVGADGGPQGAPTPVLALAGP